MGHGIDNKQPESRAKDEKKEGYRCGGHAAQDRETPGKSVSATLRRFLCNHNCIDHRDQVLCPACRRISSMAGQKPKNDDDGNGYPDQPEQK
jgi:hypothetical protein